MPKELQKTVFKKVKEGMIIMSHQIETVNKEIKIIFIKRAKGQFQELKSTITKIINSLEQIDQ